MGSLVKSEMMAKGMDDIDELGKKVRAYLEWLEFVDVSHIKSDPNE